jgi:phage gpG-like protein
MLITLDISNNNFSQLIKNFHKRLLHPKHAMATVGEIVRTSIEQNFAQGGRPVRWLPSARAKEQAGQTLSDTGRLRRSLTVDAEDDRVRVGTNVAYAPVHQFGAARGSFGTVLVHVRAHVRRIVKRNVTTRRGKKIASGVSFVKAHSRRQALPWGDIPARPFMQVQEEDWDEIADAIADFVFTGSR